MPCEEPVRVGKECLAHNEEPVVEEPDGQYANVGQRVSHEEERAACVSIPIQGGTTVVRASAI